MPASPASAYPRRHGAPVATAQAGHGRDGRLTGAHPTTTKSLNTPAPPPPRLATASQSRPIPSAPRTPPSGPTASRSHPPGTPKKTAEHAASSHGQHPDQHVRDLRSRTGHHEQFNKLRSGRSETRTGSDQPVWRQLSACHPARRVQTSIQTNRLNRCMGARGWRLGWAHG